MVVKRSVDEYIRGDVHKNNIQNVLDLFKQAVIGPYHHVSKKHLDAYLDELEWRFNNRDNLWIFRDRVRNLINTDKLEYKKLTA